MANMSNPFEIFFTNTCVIISIDTTNVINNSIENIPTDDVMIKNQNDNPAVTASDLNLGVDVCMLYRVNKSHKT